MDPRTERMLAERRQGQESPAAAVPPPPPPTTAGRAIGAVRGWLAAHWRAAVPALGVLLTAVISTHYLLVTQPARERDRSLSVQREIAAEQTLQNVASTETFEACLAAAETEYTTNWDASCRALKRAAGCTLPSPSATVHEARQRQAREDCSKKHTGR